MTPPQGLGRIEEKIDYIVKALDETQEAVSKLAECYQKSQIDYTRTNVILEQKADSAHARLDEHNKDIVAIRNNLETLAKIVASIVAQYRIINFIAGAFGLSLIGLIWGIITHSVAITIP